MPSLIKSCVAVVAASTNLGFAAVIPFRKSSSDPIPTSALISAYAVPLSNGTASLPELDKPLQIITVGRGVQNYTCASSTAADKPVAIGAVATLFDLGPLLTYFSPSQGQAILDQTPTFLLSLSHEAADNSIIPKAGHHYFDASGTPIFDMLSTNNGLITAAKNANIKAPANATQGAFGAIDWLALDAKDGANSEGLSRVYRTTTAAGSPPPSCEGQAAVVSIEYASLYYFVTA